MPEPNPNQRGGHKRRGLWAKDPARQPLGANLRPWQPGNLTSATHGARSAHLVEPVAAELVVIATESAPYLAEPSYRPALEAWASAEAKARLLDAYILSVGVLDEEGKPIPALDALRLWQKRASEERARLGLDPLSRARLGRDVAGAKLDLALLLSDYTKEEST